MSVRTRKPKRRVGEFRPQSVTQFAEPRTIKPSARELWTTVRSRLIASRPFTLETHPTWKDAKGKPKKVRVYGAPSFRNVIDETGAWV